MHLVFMAAFLLGKGMSLLSMTGGDVLPPSVKEMVRKERKKKLSIRFPCPPHSTFTRFHYFQRESSCTD